APRIKNSRSQWNAAIRHRAARIKLFLRRNSNGAARSWRFRDTRRGLRVFELPPRACKKVLEFAVQTDFLEESMSRFVRFPRRALACGTFLSVALFLVGVAGWAW